MRVSCDTGKKVKKKEKSTCTTINIKSFVVFQNVLKKEKKKMQLRGVDFEASALGSPLRFDNKEWLV